MPAWYPDYPSHEQRARYFQSDAHHFGVTQHVRFGTDVLRVEPLPGERWSLRIQRHSGNRVMWSGTARSGCHANFGRRSISFCGACYKAPIVTTDGLCVL